MPVDAKPSENAHSAHVLQMYVMDPGCFKDWSTNSTKAQFDPLVG